MRQAVHKAPSAFSAPNHTSPHLPVSPRCPLPELLRNRSKPVCDPAHPPRLHFRIARSQYGICHGIVLSATLRQRTSL
jgi:hypothetical protein